MSWGTTPMHHDNTSQSSPCHREQAAAAASVEPLSGGNGTSPSTGKGGRGEALKLGALIKPHSSCLGCWATRTMRWWGSWGTFKVPSTRIISRGDVVNAGDVGIVIGKIEVDGLMTQQTFRGEVGFHLPLLRLIYTDPWSRHILQLDCKEGCEKMSWIPNSGLMEVLVGVQR